MGEALLKPAFCLSWFGYSGRRYRATSSGGPHALQNGITSTIHPAVYHWQIKLEPLQAATRVTTWGMFVNEKLKYWLCPARIRASAGKCKV